MSEYTDDQVRQFAESQGLLDREARISLRWLREAGITVSFPEPRYYVDRQRVARGDYWWVKDRMNREVGDHPASFHGPSAEQFAREHADRLNREAP